MESECTWHFLLFLQMIFSRMTRLISLGRHGYFLKKTATHGKRTHLYRSL